MRNKSDKAFYSSIKTKLLKDRFYLVTSMIFATACSIGAACHARIPLIIAAIIKYVQTLKVLLSDNLFIVLVSSLLFILKICFEELR